MKHRDKNLTKNCKGKWLIGWLIFMCAFLCEFTIRHEKKKTPTVCHLHIFSSGLLMCECGGTKAQSWKLTVYVFLCVCEYVR